MSRLPPIPPDSLPTRGPGGAAKTSIDVTHRVRHQVRRRAATDTGRAARPEDFTFWTLGIAGAALAGILWLITQPRRTA